MIFLVILSLTSACKIGTISYDKGCISICNNTFYNVTTGKCDNYKNCQSNQYLNISNNICINACENGYYQSGICICYTG